MRRPNITANDLMDGVEVADAFGITVASLHVAMSKPHVYPALSGVLPAPLRKIGKSHVWLRYDIERAVRAKELAS